MPRIALVTLLLAGLFWPVELTRAQQSRITVTDALTRLPVAHARVYLNESEGNYKFLARTDEDGLAQLDGARAGAKIHIRALGYIPVDRELRAGGVIELTAGTGGLILAGFSAEAHVPNADVYIDGEKRGRLPLAIDDLPVGWHEIRCLPIDALRYAAPPSLYVEIEAGQSTHYFIPFTKNWRRAATEREINGDVGGAAAIILGELTSTNQPLHLLDEPTLRSAARLIYIPSQDLGALQQAAVSYRGQLSNVFIPASVRAVASVYEAVRSLDDGDIGNAWLLADTSLADRSKMPELQQDFLSEVAISVLAWRAGDDENRPARPWLMGAGEGSGSGNDANGDQARRPGGR